MLALLAWKNIWRNRKRSLIIITAITFGLWGGLLAGAVMMGWGESIFSSHRTAASFVLSGDYTFTNTFYIHTEFLYNSNGKRENAGQFYGEATYAGMLSPARWSIYQEFAYDITPLTRASIFGIYNPDDHSSILVPILSRSLSTNLELLFIGFLTSGKENAGFGAYGESINLRLKFSF